MLIYWRGFDASFCYTVRGVVKMINTETSRPEQAPLFIYVQNEVIVSLESSMAQLYQEYREDDYFLYLAYYEKNIHRHLPADKWGPFFRALTSVLCVSDRSFFD